MSGTAIGIDALTLALLILSLAKSRAKTANALKVAWNATKRIAPSILAIIAVIGILVGFIPASWIARTIGPERGALGLLFAALLGSVLFLPAIVAFPLARSLLDLGAGTMAIAAFITTLTMIGFVFLPFEIKELGKRFALIRNGLSFAAALVIAAVIGVVL
ncbi:MAG: permease [Candidatus Geothermincolia bacterium]